MECPGEHTKEYNFSIIEDWPWSFAIELAFPQWYAPVIIFRVFNLTLTIGPHYNCHPETIIVGF